VSASGATVQAGLTASPTPDSNPSATNLTPQQLAAIAWLDELRAQPVTGTPMYRPRAAEPAEPAASPSAPQAPVAPVAQASPQSQPAKEAQDPIPAAIRELTLTALVRATAAGSGTQRASINGRLRSVGDEVVAGWTIAAVEVTERRVLLRGPDGIEVYLSQVD
jgi:hypothetical protein